MENFLNWFSEKIEAISFVVEILLAIVFEWWIIAIFILSADLPIGAIILRGLGFSIIIWLPLFIFGLILFLGIPLREGFLVGEGSVMGRFVEKFKKDPESKVVQLDSFLHKAKLR